MAPHILVIDDQANLSRFIAMELYAEGYQVSISCDSIAELSKIRELNPDLIILNWELRRTSGQNICRQLQLDSIQVPIVAITVNDESDSDLAWQLGVQACLTKPFSISDLIKTIESHLKLVGQKMECHMCG
jgi:DNA-binding response OmpR family regulator